VAGLSLLGDVPVQPGADRARDLLRSELSHRVYRDAQPGLLQRLWGAVADALGGLPGPGGGLAQGVAVVVVLALVVVAVVVVVSAVGRAGRRAAPGTTGVLGAAPRTAAQLRAAAEAAAEAGRWEEAVAERFRAVVRALQERDLVGTSPGLTAGEAAAAAGAALPGAAADLRRAAALFDGVVYGERRATGADAERLAGLDLAVAGTRPGPVAGDRLVASTTAGAR
jgi:hypothetical protein